MTVIDTKPPRLPVRAWRWACNTLADFWCGFVPFIRREVASLFQRRA